MIDWKKRLYNCYISSGQAGNKYLGGVNLRLVDYPYLVHVVKKFVNADRDASIADLGCGHGNLLFVLKKMGYKNIIGVDISPEQVSLAHSMGINEVINKDLITFLEHTKQKFDVIFLMDILEHLEKNEIFELIDKVYLKLNPEGRLIIHVPNADGLYGMRVRYGDLTHETCFNQSSLRQLLSACGFNRFTFIEQTPIVHGFKSFLRFLLWKIMTFFPRVLLIAETGTVNHILSQNLLAIAQK